MHKHFLFSLSFCVLLSAMAQADNLATGPEACRALRSDAERLDCYDKLSAPGKLVTASAAAPAVNDVSPVPVARAEIPVESTVSGEDVFGLDADEVRRSYAEAVNEPELQELRARVAEIRPAGPDRVSIVLNNDQIWRQVDTSRLRLKVGDTIVIRKAAFGSFKLKKIGSNRSMRVNRGS